MKTRALFSMIAAFGMMPAVASATEPSPYDDPNIVSDCDCGLNVEIEWVSGDGDRPGVLSWINPDVPNSTVDLFDSESVIDGDIVVLPRSYILGERVDFMYSVEGNGGDVFRTDVEGDWSQFIVEQESEHVYLVFVEDTRLPVGDDDLDDAVFRVRFCAVPAPGSAALFGSGLMLMSTRRRRS